LFIKIITRTAIRFVQDSGSEFGELEIRWRVPGNKTDRGAQNIYAKEKAPDRSREALTIFQ
jgi:hypothetical protein